MGSCVSSEQGDPEQKKRSQAIDRKLEEDSRRLRRECKILLLGTFGVFFFSMAFLFVSDCDVFPEPGSGESGKSTIVKQMKIIHQNGYTVEELALYRLTVCKNLLDCAKSLVGAYHQFSLEPSSQKVRDYVQYISDYNIDPDPHTTLDVKHPASFFEEAKRIASADFIPNVNDVLRARTKTTGIYETRFTMGQLSIHMFDVGGQRSERKKWIHCFENVTSIIFCVALSEYDQVLLEESNQNRMMESLVLFDSVVNSRWFMRTSIILFLNKVDLFRQKLPRSPLSNYFPDYSGGNDVNRAAKYLLWRFNQVNRAHLNLYPQ
ncbi:G protein alpha subunit [Aspergillus pseudonomiae]